MMSKSICFSAVAILRLTCQQAIMRPWIYAYLEWSKKICKSLLPETIKAPDQFEIGVAPIIFTSTPSGRMCI